MRSVQLLDGKTFKSVVVLRNVVVNAPKGINVDEIRKRVRVIEAIDALPEGAKVLELQDLDYLTLKGALNDNVWGVADPELLALIDAVNDAKTVEGTKAKVGAGTAKG